MNSSTRLVAALSAIFTLPAIAAEADLNSRIQTLEARLAALEKPAQTRFNPDIALILSGGYARLSQNPENWKLQGFMPAGEETGPGARGFNLSESELTFSANVDHYFRGTLTFALTPENEAEVEEAKLETLALGQGFKLKAGRFLSSLGYLNDQHGHTWDFSGAPLAYQAFFGGQYKNDGVQLRWLAPTERYLEFGAEFGNGANYPGTARQQNGNGVSTVFAKLGDDLGSDASWLLGSWYQQTRAVDRTYEDTDSADQTVNNAFSGKSRSWGINATLKWNLNTVQKLKLQGEFLQRQESGELSYDVDGTSLGTATGSYRNRQSGWYLQPIYQFHPLWRTGVRFEQLNSGSARIGLVENGTRSSADFSSLTRYKPRKTSAMVDFSPSEFSRIRLQLGQEQSQAGVKDRQVFLNYTLSLGAHAAHSY